MTTFPPPYKEDLVTHFELIRQASSEANVPAMNMGINALGVKVYEVAYHREPPLKAAFGF